MNDPFFESEPESTSSDVPFSTIPLPDGVVIGGAWPDTIITWPGIDGGKGGAPRFRKATKPEHDLFQVCEKLVLENAKLKEDTARLDWMQANPQQAEVVTADGRQEIAHAWAIASAFPQLRDAIDAARRHG